MTRNLESPVLLDSARVLLYASTGGAATYTGRRIIIAGGEVIDPVPCLAICENLFEGNVLLMHCDAAWNVVGAAFYSSVAEAKAAAEDAYSGISSKWQELRKLTDQESGDVEKLRQSLRGLVAEDPIDSDPHAA